MRYIGITLVYLFLNVCTLSIGCFLLKKKSPIGIRKFLTHILSAVVGGGLIQLVLFSFYPVFHSVDKSISPHISKTSSFLGLFWYYFFPWRFCFLVSLILGGYNYWLSRKFLNTSKKQSVFIGTIMGIFTNLFWLFPLLLLLIWLHGLL